MLLGSTSIKAACKMLMKLTLGINFINVLHTAFTCADPENGKIQLSCQFYAFGIYRHKSFVLNVDEIDTWSMLLKPNQSELFSHPACFCLSKFYQLKPET